MRLCEVYVAGSGLGMLLWFVARVLVNRADAAHSSYVVSMNHMAQPPLSVSPIPYVSKG